MSIQFSNTSKKGLIGGVFLIIAVLIGGGVYLTSQLIVPKLKTEFQLKKSLVVLLIGNVRTTEAGKDLYLERKLIMTVADPSVATLSLVSIPGDTLVDIPGIGLGRIKEAGSLTEENLTNQLVSDLTGYKINRYMSVNVDSLKEFVDLLGGVMIDVEEELKDTGDPQSAKVKLAPGVQLLNGKKALQYIRFYSTNDDLDKVTRLQKLMIAVVKKSAQPANVVKIPKFQKLINKHVKTNLSTQEITQLAYFARNLDPEKNIACYTLPGSYFESYWKTDPIKLHHLMTKLKPVDTNW